MEQITLNFQAGMSATHEWCREFLRDRIPLICLQRGIRQKTIAGDMDLAPSMLTRKLAQSPNDSAHFWLDDLERYIAVTGDTEPVLYLVEKYLAGRDTELLQLKRRIAELEARGPRG